MAFQYFWPLQIKGSALFFEPLAEINRSAIPLRWQKKEKKKNGRVVSFY